MLKLTAGLLAVTLCLSCFGQQNIYEGDFLEKHTVVSALVNEDIHASLVSYIHKSSVKRVVVPYNQPAIHLLYQHTSEKDHVDDYQKNSEVAESVVSLLWHTSPIGGYFDPKWIVEISRDRKNLDFYFTQTNLSTGVCTVSDTIVSNVKEKIIGCTNRKGAVQLITYLNETDKLLIYTKKPGQAVERTEIIISTDGFGKLSNNLFASEINHFSGIFNKSSFAVYQNNLRYHPLFHSVRTKAYFQKDKLVFTVNSNNLLTYVISINLSDFSYQLQQFDQQPGEGKTAHPSTNSVLVDSLLVTSHFAGDQLLLRVFNITTGMQLTTVGMDKSNINSILTQPIQQAGSFWSKAAIRTESFETFQRTAQSNQLALSAYAREGKLFLAFATPYKQLITATTLLNLTMSAAGTYFLSSAPNTYGYMLVNFPQVRTSTFISFAASLSLPDCRISTEEGNLTVWDKLQSQLQLRKINPANSHFYFMDGYYYIGYISDRKYRIFRFDERGIE